MLSIRTIMSLVIVLLTVQLAEAQTWHYSGNNAYYNSGNVGIGNADPAVRLHVTDSTGNAVPALIQRFLNTNNAFGASILTKSTFNGDMVNGFGTGIGFQIRDNAGVDNTLGIVGAARSGADNSGSMVFYTYNAGAPGERMRITNTGNVGIGNINPAYLLDITRNTNDATPTINIRNSNAGVSAQSVLNFFNNAGSTFTTHGAMLSLTSSTTTTANTFQIWNFMNGAIRFGTNNAETMRMDASGKLGIGTSTPAEKLDVAGNIKATGIIIPTGAAAGKVLTSDANGNATWQTATGSSSGWALGGNEEGSTTTIGNKLGHDLHIITNNTERIRVLADGRVAIGAPNNLPATDAKLAVYGHIYSTKVKITQTGWADYVFDNDYRLRPLSEVEEYIQQHRHLPEVPSAKDVEKDGLDLGDNQATLLKKIEELTLYVIEQNKKLETQLKLNNEQNKRLDQQQQEIKAMRKRTQPNQKL